MFIHICSPLSNIRFCLKNWKHLKVKLNEWNELNCGFSLWKLLCFFPDCLIRCLFCCRIWRARVWTEAVVSDLCCPEDHLYVHPHLLRLSGSYSWTAAHSRVFSHPQGLPGLPGPPGPQVHTEICTKTQRNLAWSINSVKPRYGIYHVILYVISWNHCIKNACLVLEVP